MKRNLTNIQLHSAGATIRHSSPFDQLLSYENEEELTQGFIDEWVKPFYRNVQHFDKEWISTIQKVRDQITDEIIFKNLGDFNWRTRTTGAFFAAIRSATYFTDIIGTHLLKSEVCYAGNQYAVTLASFNTDEAIQYLNRYLEYYLTRPDLAFDQTSVMTALIYLDEENQTNEQAKHEVKWQAYLKRSTEKAEADFNKIKSELKLDVDELIAYPHDINDGKSKIDTAVFRKSIKVIEHIKNTLPST